MLLSESAGTIGVCTAEAGRFSRFWACLEQMERPPGTKPVVLFGANIAENLNAALRQRIGPWFQFWGDDHTFAPDLLTRMLRKMDDYPEIDLLIPFTVRRTPPFSPVIFVDWWHNALGVPTHMPLACVPPPSKWHMPIVSTGLAGAVIREHVLEAIGDPWFEWGHKMDLTHPEGPYKIRQGEDMVFCDKMTALGMKIFVDLENTVGHIIAPSVEPRWTGKDWVVDLKIGDKLITSLKYRLKKEPK